jgi:hypothetical protein
VQVAEATGLSAVFNPRFSQLPPLQSLPGTNIRSDGIACILECGGLTPLLMLGEKARKARSSPRTPKSLRDKKRQVGEKAGKVLAEASAQHGPESSRKTMVSRARMR